MQNVPFKQFFSCWKPCNHIATEVGGVHMEEVKKEHARKALNKCGFGQPLTVELIRYLDVYQGCFLPVAQ